MGRGREENDFNIPHRTKQNRLFRTGSNQGTKVHATMTQPRCRNNEKQTPFLNGGGVEVSVLDPQEDERYSLC